MTHDPLCNHSLNKHRDRCVICYLRGCECEIIIKARIDERESAAQKLEQYGKENHPSHAPNYGCQRCDIHAAYNTAADIVRRKL